MRKTGTRDRLSGVFRNRRRGGVTLCGGNRGYGCGGCGGGGGEGPWRLLGICAVALGAGILIAAIFPVGLLMFLVAFLLIGCGYACCRR